jgi:TPR repeat protein
MINLARLYQSGLAGEENISKSAKLFEQAITIFSDKAQNGDNYAVFYLGAIYENGQGVPANQEKAIEYYKKSAEMGNAEAQDKISQFYLSGQCLAQDLEKGFEWCKKSALQGSSHAMYNLAVCYEHGNGTEKNPQEAIQLYMEAGLKYSNPDALFNLACCFYNGIGVAASKEQALNFFTLAANNGHRQAMQSAFFLSMELDKSRKETEN